MFKKISNKIQFLKFLKRSRTNSKIIKRIVKKKICIIDIGAGHRYLSSLLNFDGSAEIHMIDPHKSLLWSSENLKKIIENKEDVKTYQVGIGAQTMKKVMYMGTRPTASTFLNIFKLSKGKKYELDMKYFSKNKQLVNIFSFKDFLKKFNIKSPSIIKIDVEGMEDIVLNSILKSCRPFLLQIEVNVNSELYNNTFNKINAQLIKLNYELKTFYPTYLNKKNNYCIKGNYDYPEIRSSIGQLDCIYVLKKRNTNLQEVAILMGFGFSMEAIKKIQQIKKVTPKLKEEINFYFKNLSNEMS